MHSGSRGSGHSYRASKALQICCNPVICREGQLAAAGFMTEESSTWQVNALTGSQQTGQSLHTATLPHLMTQALPDSSFYNPRKHQ